MEDGKHKKIDEPPPKRKKSKREHGSSSSAAAARRINLHCVEPLVLPVGMRESPEVHYCTDCTED